MGSSVIRKLEAVLRLSKSENIGEAANAAAIAKQMVEKYNIAIEILEEKGEIILKDSIIDYMEAYDEPFRKSPLLWEQALALVVANTYKCRVFLVEEDLNIAGRSTDIEIVDSMLSWLHSRLGTLILRDGIDRTPEWIEGYMLGAVEKIRSKFKEAEEEVRSKMKMIFEDAGGAIVRIEKRLSEVDKFLEDDKMNPNVVKVTNSESYDLGFDSAESISVNQTKEIE